MGSHHQLKFLFSTKVVNVLTTVQRTCGLLVRTFPLPAAFFSSYHHRSAAFASSPACSYGQAEAAGYLFAGAGLGATD